MAKTNEPEGTLNTIIGMGTRFEGSMEVAQSLRIDGFVKGTLTAGDTLIVGAASQLDEVNVTVKNAIISGAVKGNVTASNRVVLESGSRLEGDLTAKLLIIQEGAHFSGNCRSGGRMQNEPGE